MKALGVTGQEMVDLPKWAYHPKTGELVNFYHSLILILLVSVEHIKNNRPVYSS